MANKLYLHHKTGGTYLVLFRGLMEADLKPVVIYTDFPNRDNVWVRPEAEFFDGRFQCVGEYRDHNVFDPIGDIIEFHEKFGLDYSGPPCALEPNLSDFRYRFSLEETDEWKAHNDAAFDETTRAPGHRDAANYVHHIEESLDAHVDQVYVTLGTAYMQGFFAKWRTSRIFIEAWRRVHLANMQKVRAQLDTDSKRGSTYDVVKPAGWQAPSHTDLVEAAADSL